MVCVGERGKVPFLTFAASTSRSSWRFDFSTRSLGGLEYRVRIS